MAKASAGTWHMGKTENAKYCKKPAYLSFKQSYF